MPTVEQAQAWYAGTDPVHDWSHVQRVTTLAERIAAAEGADVEIVRAAALLHDVPAPPTPEARARHHLWAADFAADVLAAEGWPTDRIAAVQHCIRAHRFRGDEAPTTPEARALFDADKLDAIGAIGALRAGGYAARHNNPLAGPVSELFRATGQLDADEAHTPEHEFIIKLSRIPGRLTTQTGRTLAEQRSAFLADFFAQLERELAGHA
ncbi:MAG: HD domain-containing protein [Anaerolineales bacterium]|nr:HD domain-containing protein [Anaerolineales bacterium]